MDHQNLSEHVLCMVLYLIELGLENSPERESDEEVVRCFILIEPHWKIFIKKSVV